MAEPRCHSAWSTLWCRTLVVGSIRHRQAQSHSRARLEVPRPNHGLTTVVISLGVWQPGRGSEA